MHNDAKHKPTVKSPLFLFFKKGSVFFFEKKKQKTFDCWILVVLTAATLLCLPFIRTVQWLGDEGVCLSGALRLLHGLPLYTATVSPLPPGAFLITASWMSVFGTSIVAARLLATASVAGIACCTYLSCGRAAGYRPLAASLAIAWVLMTQGLGTQVSHHYFTTFFSMLSAWLALTAAGRTRYGLYLEGLAYLSAGIAVVITPPQGALVAIALTAALPKPVATRAYLSGLMIRAAALAAGPVFALAYIAVSGGLAAAYQDIIVFPAAHYSAIQWVAFGAGASPQNLPLALLFPASGLATLLVLARRGISMFHCRQYRLCIALAAAGSLGAWPRPDISHLGFTAPLMLPLLCYGLISLAKPSNHVWPAALVAATLALCVPAATAYRTLLIETKIWIKVPTAQGTIRMPARFRNSATLITALATAPGTEQIFFYPYLMMMPYLTGHDQVSHNDIFVPGYTTPAQYQEANAAVMASADWVVIEKSWTQAKFLQTIFPAMRQPNPPEKRTIEQAIETNFDLTREDADFIIRRKKPKKISKSLNQP